jgi:hypothetical protein
MESKFLGIVLITPPEWNGGFVNERPMEVWSGFFVGRADLKRKA